MVHCVHKRLRMILQTLYIIMSFKKKKYTIRQVGPYNAENNLVS